MPDADQRRQCWTWTYQQEMRPGWLQLDSWAPEPRYTCVLELPLPGYSSQGTPKDGGALRSHSHQALSQGRCTRNLGG